jgi:hypothetical protein
MVATMRAYYPLRYAKSARKVTGAPSFPAALFGLLATFCPYEWQIHTTCFFCCQDGRAIATLMKNGRL